MGLLLSLAHVKAACHCKCDLYNSATLKVTHYLPPLSPSPQSQMQGPGQCAGSTHTVERPLICHGGILVAPGCLTFHLHAVCMQMNQNNKSILTSASIVELKNFLK